MLAITKQMEEAYELLKRVHLANVNYHDAQRKTAIKLALTGKHILKR
jgi:hypothetical protein